MSDGRTSTEISRTSESSFDSLRRDFPITDGEKEFESLSRTDYLWLFALLATGIYIFIQSLGQHPLNNWDEAIYANVARHMVQNGKWLIPHLYLHPQKGAIQLQPFLEKPPLVFWLQGLSMSIFGVSRFAARLPVAIFAILSGGLIYYVGRQIVSRTAGIIAAVVLFTTPMVFAAGHGGRTGSTDVPLVFFGTLFVFLTWVAFTRDRRDLLPYVGIAAGLAVLTKGFSAGTFVIAVAPVVLAYYQTLLSREAILMVGITFVIVLPWSLYAWIQYGQEFVYQIFLQQVVGRATGSNFTSQSGLFEFMRYPYFTELPRMFDPWLLLVIPAVAGAFLWGIKRERVGIPLFLCWWAVSTIGFYAVTGNHGWYIMPMFVPCALLIGMGGDAIVEEYPKLMVASGFAVAAVILQTGATVGMVLLGIGLIICSERRGFREKFGDTLSGVQEATIFRVVPIVFACILVIALAGGVPVADGASYNEPEQLGRATNQHVPTGTSIAMGPEMPKEFAFSFYAQRPLTNLPGNELANAQQGQYVVVTAQTHSQLGGRYETVYEGRKYALVHKTGA